MPYPMLVEQGFGSLRQGPLLAIVGGAESRPLIAVDRSTWVASLEGGRGEDARMLDRALADRQVVMVPAVLSELLSEPKLTSAVSETLAEVPLIEITSGYWRRAKVLGAKVLTKHRKERLGDALIAQSCIDGDTPLLTRDRDFRAFAETVASTFCLFQGRADLSWSNRSLSFSGEQFQS